MSVPKNRSRNVIPVEASVVGRELLCSFLDLHEVTVELNPGAIEKLCRKPHALSEPGDVSVDTPSE